MMQDSRRDAETQRRQSFFLWVLSLLLLTLVGCQQRTVSKLQGRWEGRPDSAALRAEREAEKYGNSSGADVEASTNSKEGSSTKPDASVQVTDWENYEVTVQMDFVSSERLEMSLDGEQRRSAHWQIISSSPIGCTIEVQTEEGSEGDEKKELVRRRFELVLDEREGTCVGFLLTEVGADRLLGAIYFKRPQQ